MQDPERDEILYRLDERTARIESDINDVKDTNDEQEERIQENQRVSRKNRTKLNAITLGVGSALSAFLAKMGGLIKI